MKINVGFKLAVILLMSAFLQACEQASASVSVVENDTTQTFESSVTDEQLKLVRQHLYKDLRYGNWRLDEIKDIKGEINAFIRIPEKLDMSKVQAQDYIRLALCPEGDKAFWETLDDVTLALHLYTNKVAGKIINTTWANCKSKLASKNMS